MIKGLVKMLKVSEYFVDRDGSKNRNMCKNGVRSRQHVIRYCTGSDHVRDTGNKIQTHHGIGVD